MRYNKIKITHKMESHLYYIQGVNTHTHTHNKQAHINIQDTF